MTGHFFKGSLFKHSQHTVHPCNHTHAHTRVSVLSSFCSPWTLAQREKHFPLKVSLLSAFLSRKTQRDPGKEQGWCPPVRAPSTLLHGSNNEKESVHCLWSLLFLAVLWECHFVSASLFWINKKPEWKWEFKINGGAELPCLRECFQTWTHWNECHFQCFYWRTNCSLMGPLKHVFAHVKLNYIIYFFLFWAYSSGLSMINASAHCCQYLFVLLSLPPYFWSSETLLWSWSSFSYVFFSAINPVGKKKTYFSLINLLADLLVPGPVNPIRIQPLSPEISPTKVDGLSACKLPIR